jgi:hypothetical protein
MSSKVARARAMRIGEGLWIDRQRLTKDQLLFYMVFIY